jgi:hypothetical protein
MSAKIYRPTKTAMQSGKGNTHDWVLEFLPESPKTIDPIMGWTSSSDTQTQLKMKFENCEEAEKYAQSHKIDYIIIKPKTGKLIKQAYADNFTRADVYTQN